MAEIITSQAVLFLRSVGYGLLLGIWYEVFRVLRQLFIHRDSLVHMEDAVFCFSGAAGLFFLFQLYNRGSMRFYILLGLALGGGCYFLVLYKPVQWLLKQVVKLAVIIPGKLAGMFCIPLKLIMNSIVKSLKKIRRTVRIIKSRK